MYKLFTPLGRTEPKFIIRLADNIYIPFHEANTDYQEYIEWTKESPANVAAPADE